MSSFMQSNDMRYLGYGGDVSNINHLIPEDLADKLRAAPAKVFVQHVAMNFCAYLWWDGKHFVEEVWVHHAKVATLHADTIEGVMKLVKDEYGYE